MVRSKKISQVIYKEIKNNPKITEFELAEKYFYSERTIRRKIREIRKSGKIDSIGTGKKHKWIIK